MASVVCLGQSTVSRCWSQDYLNLDELLSLFVEELIQVYKNKLWLLTNIIKLIPVEAIITFNLFSVNRCLQTITKKKKIIDQK